MLFSSKDGVMVKMWRSILVDGCFIKTIHCIKAYYFLNMLGCRGNTIVTKTFS